MLKMFLVYLLPIALMGLSHAQGSDIAVTITFPTLLAFFLAFKTRNW